MTPVKTFPVEAGWRTLLKDLGVKPADVMRRAGLPEDLLTRPQVGLSTADYFSFWRSLEAAVGDPLFPLRLVDAITPEIFSPPIFAALCSPNLRLATQRLSHYKRLVAPMALDVSVDKRQALSLSPRWLDARVVPPLAVVVSELAFFVRLAQLATREPIRAVQVTMPTIPEPLPAYEHYFGASIRKGKTPSISFSAADAELPFLTANDGIWRVFEPDLRRRLTELDETASMSERVRAQLLESLPSGQTSIDAIAGRLAMSKRTLQRRLGGDGVTFQSLVNQTREALARHYLSQTTLSNGEISFLLGFEDPNSFFKGLPRLDRRHARWAATRYGSLTRRQLRLHSRDTRQTSCQHPGRKLSMFRQLTLIARLTAKPHQAETLGGSLRVPEVSIGGVTCESMPPVLHA